MSPQWRAPPDRPAPADPPAPAPVDHPALVDPPAPVDHPAPVDPPAPAAPVDPPAPAAPVDPPAPAAPVDPPAPAAPVDPPAPAPPVDPPAPADPAAPPPPPAPDDDQLVLTDPTVINEMLQVVTVVCPHCGRPDLRIEPGRTLGYAVELTMRCAGCEVDLVWRFSSRRMATDDCVTRQPFRFKRRVVLAAKESGFCQTGWSAQ